MRKTLALLLVSTALTATIGLPAWSAMRTEANVAERPLAAVFDDGAAALPLILVSGDDDDEEDDDDDDDDDDDCDDDDGGKACRGARNPAPAGTVAPPQNGLFGNGAPPQVQMN